MIVTEFMRMPIESMGDRHDFLIDIDRRDVTAQKTNVPYHLPYWIDDVGEVEVARCDLVKHRGEQEEVLSIDYRYFESGIFKFFELQRRVEAAKTTAQNQYASLFLLSHA